MAEPGIQSSAARTPTIRVIYRDGMAFAREGSEEWPISEVPQKEMLWAPDGYRFAFLKPSPEAREANGQRSIVIRNIRGDPFNEFSAYASGDPLELDWIDNDQIGYILDDDKSGAVYIIHSADTGEVLHVMRGSRFIWSPGRKHLAYVSGKTHAQQVNVSKETVWPRILEPKRKKCSIVSNLIWSPDGTSLAFMERNGIKSYLVVLLVLDNPEGDLVWPLPDGALKPENQIFWAESKVIIGKSALQPSYAASWKRLR